MNQLPRHLRKYIVEQDYAKYTPVDHAVWRFILRQLRAYLGRHAHDVYLQGLKDTGIEVERIPRIADISAHLEKFGWRALPVSGFIPPAAFMELQSLGVLPIASDMRSLDHLEYTPAPDIVHEAAGHAPILVHPEFAAYLRQYAQVARKAILSRQDLKQYEAIRELSDLKENPDSTPAQIEAATARLNEVNANMGEISEAGELSRMNWWTAEYGLIGSLDNPKIFGAGLLSSVGESRWCLGPNVKRLPLTVECIRQTYDITEPQPQLFVAADFPHLSAVLEEMAANMAFRLGGRRGFEKAVRAESVNTIELNSGLQISGQWTEAQWDPADGAANPRRAIFVKAVGPAQLALGDRELKDQGPGQHPEGFSTPLGAFAKFPGRCPSTLSDAELAAAGLRAGERARLELASGFVVEGVLSRVTRAEDGRLLLLTWTDCRVTAAGKTYFEPAWGVFDQAVGLEIVSVYGGPADTANYGERDDFVAARVPPRTPSELERTKHRHYQELRELRESDLQGAALVAKLEPLVAAHARSFPQDWLLKLEGLELILSRASAGTEALQAAWTADLERVAAANPRFAQSIRDGLALAAEY